MKVLFLTGDYWHSAESIRPLAEKLFPDGNYVYTEDPKVFLEGDYDLLILFKDTVENNQIPTPCWADEEWTERLLKRVREGMGLMAIHAGMADLKPDHPLVKELYHGAFLGHPAQCPLSFRPVREHPLLEGIEEFTYPDKDEHYHMGMLPGSEGEILAVTVSEHGEQPGLWAHGYGKGKVCMFTPAHDTPNLICDPNVRLFRNMIRWCTE